MTDLELLELAAKAEGRTTRYMTDVTPGREPERFIACWNPLVSDGDAMRLAVELRLHICNPGAESWAQSYRGNGNGWLTIKEPHKCNAAAATRRAIVRAAAAIATAKQEGAA